MAITPTISVYDLNVTDETADAVLLQAWLDTLTITTFYELTVTPISNSRLRYTLTYA